MKNEPEKAPTSVTFSINDLRRLDDEALGGLIVGRVDELARAYPPEAKIGPYNMTTTPMRRLCEWFLQLPHANFATFFEATIWPPKEETKEAQKPRKPARSKPKPAAKPKPTARAKRSKTKAEVAALRKSKRAAKPKQQELPLASSSSKAKPKRPPIATGDQLAGDLNTRDALLAFVRGAPTGVTAGAIQDHLILSPGQTKGLLKRLREQGAIRVEGKNRGAKYFAGAGKAKGKDEEE